MRASGSLLAGLAAAALALCLSCPAPAQAEDIVLDGIIALVNGKAVTKFEHDQRLLPIYEQTRGRNLSPQDLAQIATIKRQLLDQMVDDILIQQDAERYKLKVTDAEVDAQIKDFMVKRQLNEEELKKQLALQRMSREDFIRNMRRDMVRHRLIGSVVSNKVVVTDTEVEQYYKEHKAEYSKDAMVQLGIILAPAGVSAEELKAQIEAGQLSFAEAAKRYSQGPNAATGGDIGFIAWKDLAPEWNAALSGLKVGQITPPLRVQDFAGLLQVLSLKEGEELPVDAVRDQIYQSLQDGKFEKVFKDYLQKLREKAVIEYRAI